LPCRSGRRQAGSDARQNIRRKSRQNIRRK
jgi:hypothetical protein